jgi:hypothetical protein
MQKDFEVCRGFQGFGREDYVSRWSLEVVCGERNIVRSQCLLGCHAGC